MRATRLALAVSAALAALASGCTQLPSRTDQASTIRPVYRVTSLDGNYDALFALGRYELANRNSRAAIDAFARAAALRPAGVQALNALAVAYASAGQHDDAVATFRRAIELEPTAAHLYSNLGFELLRTGRIADAEGMLREAARLDPANLKTRENVALLEAAKTRGPALAAAPPQPVAPAGTPAEVVAPAQRELPGAPVAVEPSPARASVVESAGTLIPAPIVASQPSQSAQVAAPIVASAGTVIPAPIVPSQPSQVIAPIAESVGAPVPARIVASSATPIVQPALPPAAHRAAAAVAAPPAPAPAVVIAKPAPARSPEVAEAPELRAAAATPAASPAPTPIRSTLVEVAPRVYELRERPVAGPAHTAGAAAAAAIPARHAGHGAAAIAGGPSPVASAAQAPVLLPPAAPEAFAANPEHLRRMRIDGLEVSNGVGTLGLAARTARGLRGLGFAPVRVSDYLDFDQGRTIILYRPGHLAQAKELRKALPHRVVLIASRKLLRSEINVRLVIGHDLAGRRILAWAGSPEVARAGVLAEWNAVLGRSVDLGAYADAVGRVDAADGWRWS